MKPAVRALLRALPPPPPEFEDLVPSPFVDERLGPMGHTHFVRHENGITVVRWSWQRGDRVYTHTGVFDRKLLYYGAEGAS